MEIFLGFGVFSTFALATMEYGWRGVECWVLYDGQLDWFGTVRIL